MRKGMCRICLSPYRKEIVSAYKEGISSRRLYKKYAPLMNYNSKPASFAKILQRHIKDEHNEDAIVIPSAPDSAIQVKRATLEGYAMRMLDLGMAKADNSTPGDIKFRDVNQAVKLQLDAQKLKIAEDAMALAMAKMFGPPIAGEVIGEGVEDAEYEPDGISEPGREQDSGV